MSTDRYVHFITSVNIDSSDRSNLDVSACLIADHFLSLDGVLVPNSK